MTPGHSGRAPAAPLPGQTPGAHTAAVALRVGALFEHDAGGGHFCTASVVASPGKDLLITAAHCINGLDSMAVGEDQIVGLPGPYQVGWGEDGVCVRGRSSGAGDRDERDRVGGDPVPVALERYEVVVVELACLQPLDRAEE